jgi:ribosomal protein S18 acetylase RimI-like enzyme
MLYSVQKKDIRQASEVLADAFEKDPIWSKLYEGESDYNKKLSYALEVSARHCRKYGGLYAPSEKLEGVIGWVPGEFDDMTMGRVLACGGMSAAMRMGASISKKMLPVFKPISDDRHKYMAGRKYLYILIVGVRPELHGNGFGGKLIGSVIEKSEAEKIPVYLETETEGNVKMYEHFGFEVLHQITLPVIDVPMWEMLREPRL